VAGWQNDGLLEVQLWAHKKDSMPALKSGNAGMLIILRSKCLVEQKMIFPG
jgi:hypothetical protein